jgi:hypothetical protein
MKKINTPPDIKKLHTSKISREYAIAVKNIMTHLVTGEKTISDWVILAGWYISPKKAVSSYKNSAYPRDWNSFADIKIVERELLITDRDLEEDLSKFGIQFTRK